MKKDKVKLAPTHLWLSDPEDHDFPAATDYLELLFPLAEAQKFTEELKQAKTIIKKSKDIFRASGLPLLTVENRHVKQNIKKWKSGEQLSPILLVRFNNTLIIADGYHRMCASYYLTEDLEVPCRLV